MPERLPSPEEHRRFTDETLPHLDAVWSAARHLAPDRESAEDLVQETYLRAFRSFDEQGRGQLRSWLVAICVNTARSEHRRVQRRPGQVDATRLDTFATGDEASTVALVRLDREKVAWALKDLPEVQRVAIVMVDIAGLTAREAADVLGVPGGRCWPGFTAAVDGWR